MEVMGSKSENSGNSLSSLQLELLKVYSFEPSEEEIKDIRTILGNYFGEKLTAKVERAARQKGITEVDLDKWLDEEA